MYHAIVRRRIAALFEAINAGDAGPVLNGFADVFEHVFIGDHALGGTRRSLAATQAWYERLFRLLQGLTFTLERIDVKGPPWNTLATVEWREQNHGTDGITTSARGVHIAHIRWGRMTRLVIVPDTTKLEATLARALAQGVAEAGAPPIIS